LEKINPDNWAIQVMAIAEGQGCNWAMVAPATQELNFRLVKDSLVSGRILDSDGKPVKGAKVRVSDLRAYRGENLNEQLETIRTGGVPTRPEKIWYGPFPGQDPSVTTGDDGKFSMKGLGCERIVDLVVEGPTIRHKIIHAMTRVGESVVNADPFWQQRIYAATFDYLAEPSRTIHGVVRDKETGKPLSGVRIESLGTTHQTTTDKDGRYELLGHGKSQDYILTATPPTGQPYFIGNPSFPDTPGLTTLEADIVLFSGITITGRVTDKETGKPVAGASIAYYPVFPNPHTRTGLGESLARTGPDGSYSVVVLKGPGLIAVTAPDVNHYIPAHVTVKEMEAFYQDEWVLTRGMEHSESTIFAAMGSGGARPLPQLNYNALALIRPGANGETPIRNVDLQPAATLRGTVVGPDGKVLSGATAYGLFSNPFGQTELTTGDFTVHGLDPSRPRQLLFFHKEKGLGCYQEIQGEEKGPLTVKLQPLGSASGRILDKDGQPRAELALRVARPSILENLVPVKTDKDGLFRIEGLVPGQRYHLWANQTPGNVQIVVESGKNKDLADVVLDASK
jgi:protocatechuate 3,4-dioxygenase beta subunit